MDRQIKHRILGVLVLAGLIVIMLPLFQTKNELPSQAALVNAPPFPDQTEQRTNAELNQEIAAIGQIDGAAQPIPLTVTTEPLITPVPDKLDSVKQAADLPRPFPKPETPPVAVKPPMTKPTVIQPVAQPIAKPKTTIKPAGPKVKMVKKKVAPHKVKHIAKKAKHKKMHLAQKVKKPRRHMLGGYQVLDPSDVIKKENGVVKIKTKAWAVQVGSFKSKHNAVRLVNKLRLRGYRTFIKQASSSKRGLTKVLVGPESKKENAHMLASKLATEANVRGIVVHYKPLTL